MRIAILGDIHANLEALGAVLADVDEHRVDQIYSVGDIIGYGADPRACLSIVRERDIPAVLGNWEVALNGSSVEQFNPYAKAAIYWTRGALTLEEKKFLGGLPEERIVDGYQIVHGSPAGDKTGQYVLKDKDVREAFPAAQAPVVFIGHTHVQFACLDEDPIAYSKEDSLTLPADTTAIINVGAVGQPRDGDPRARWCLYDTEARTVLWRRVAYDVERVGAKIREAGLPEVFAERLVLGK